jgi:hypothetical protein
MSENKDEGQVVDFAQVREQKLDEKRRRTERIFFQNLLGVYTVIGETEMRQIELVELSETGCSFQFPNESKVKFDCAIETDVPLRLYFSQDTYIPIRVKVANRRHFIENGHRYIRFGCQVDTTLSSYEAYEHFVKFMRAYSMHSHKDNGDISVFYV